MAADANGTATTALLEDRLEPLVRRVVASFEMAGLAIGIVAGGEVVYAKGFGVRDVRTQEPVTADSLFHLASVSKPFVATAVMQLVEQGKVQLDAPVVRYLPYVTMDDERAGGITVHQMLSHVSGMPDEADYHWDQPEDDAGALERYVRGLAGYPLLFAPGERFSYSNIAYEVLGDLIATVSGLPFETYMQREVLAPLGMARSTFLKRDVPAQWATAPHIAVPQVMPSPIYPYHRAHAPSSTLHSSAQEMCSWARANLGRGSLNGERILSASSFDLLWHPYARTNDGEPAEFMGLGWFLSAHKGHRRITHGGSDTGFQSSFALLPDLGVGVVVLANALPAPVYEIRQAALDVLLGDEPESPTPPVLIRLNESLHGKSVAAALDLYRVLREQQPHDYDFAAQPLFDVGNILRETGRVPEALRVLNLGLAIDPEAAEGYTLLALVYLKAGDLEQARANAAQALQRDPRDAISFVLHRRLSQ